MLIGNLLSAGLTQRVISYILYFLVKKTNELRLRGSEDLVPGTIQLEWAICGLFQLRYQRSPHLLNARACGERSHDPNRVN